MCFGLTDRNPVALKVIHERRSTLASPVHRLRKNTTKEQSQNGRSKGAEVEARRRDEIQKAYMELSKYFEVPAGCKGWVCTKLLLRGKYDRGRSQ